MLDNDKVTIQNMYIFAATNLNRQKRIWILTGLYYYYSREVSIIISFHNKI